MLLVVLNRYFITDAIHNFQNKALPWIMNHYESLLQWALKGWRPVQLLIGVIALFFVSLFVFVASGTCWKVV
jgi:multidrug efflux pump subunit AcrB